MATISGNNGTLIVVLKLRFTAVEDVHIGC